jgi:hypothetical protein
MKTVSYQVYVGAECASFSTDQEKEISTFWRLRAENPNRAVIFTKTEVLATNTTAKNVLKQQAAI